MSSFQSAEREGVHIITCPPLVETNQVPTIEVEAKSWLLSSANTHVIDMKDVTKFSQAAYRVFIQFNQSLKNAKKHFYCVNVPANLLNQFRSDGLTNVFVPVANIDEAKKKAAPPRSTIDVDFVNPFIEGTKKVLETQASQKIVVGKPYLRKPEENIPMEIAGVLALTSDTFTGSISLCFRAPVFLAIYESMVGEKATEITSDIEDAAAELLNMIFGHAKTVLNDQKGHKLHKAIPTILAGEKLKIRHKTHVAAMVLPFESPVGTFHIEIVLDKT